MAMVRYLLADAANLLTGEGGTLRPSLFRDEAGRDMNENKAVFGGWRFPVYKRQETAYESNSVHSMWRTQMAVALQGISICFPAISAANFLVQAAFGLRHHPFS
jgi:hypothetical protein